MIKIMFVCHGNICRSTMCEFLFRDMVEKMGCGEKFFIASSATSREEIGNGVHSGTRMILEGMGIDSSKKRAVQLTKEDKDRYDYFIGMDSANVRNMTKILGDKSKIYKLTEFAGSDDDIADPWYTGDFEATYRDAVRGLNGFIEYLKINKKM